MARCAYCKIEDTELFENDVPICISCSTKRDKESQDSKNSVEGQHANINTVIGEARVHQQDSERVKKISRKASGASNER